MTTSLISILINTATLLFSGGGYSVGDKASDFELKNVDGKMISLSDFPDAKGFVVIFTCNHCPYAQAYQDRIIALDQAYKSRGYPVIAVNSNNPVNDPRETYENMIVRAKEKGFTFPYLKDPDQNVLMKYGALYTPTVYLLQKDNNNNLTVKYVGAIDDNYSNPSAVKVPYVQNALDALLSGHDPEPGFTKAIGCGIPYDNSSTMN